MFLPFLLSGRCSSGRACIPAVHQLKCVPMRLRAADVRGGGSLHRLFGALALGVLALGSACGTKEPAAQLQGAVLTAVKGTVQILGQTGPARAVGAGDLYTERALLFPGMTLSVGKDSRADLEFSTGTLVRLSSCTQLRLQVARIVESKGFSRIDARLESGQALTKTDRLSRNSTFAVTTPTAVASVRGTTFLVSHGAPCAPPSPGSETRTLVTDGSVVVSDPSGRTSRVADAGTKATVGASGVVVAAPLSAAERSAVGDEAARMKPMSDEDRSRVRSLVPRLEQNRSLYREAVQESSSGAPPAGPSSPSKPKRSDSTPSAPRAQDRAPATTHPAGPKTEAKTAPSPATGADPKPKSEPTPAKQEKKGDDNVPML